MISIRSDPDDVFDAFFCPKIVLARRAGRLLGGGVFLINSSTRSRRRPGVYPREKNPLSYYSICLAMFSGSANPVYSACPWTVHPTDHRRSYNTRFVRRGRAVSSRTPSARGCVRAAERQHVVSMRVLTRGIVSSLFLPGASFARWTHLGASPLLGAVL